ncbi:MAG: class I SAM-dependent methyltransferase [Chroococcus sp. CMT-3BRIN-NPC107]|nr:class I SAM-dependent methyltransferase [Chroococcus sp. CMT-3BRIN-NPC107]
MIISDWRRPERFARPSYEPSAPQEEFIVKLLRSHIEQVLVDYGKPSSSNSCALDVGCGRQPFRQELEALGYTYSSIDVHQNPEGSVDVICEIDQPLPQEIDSDSGFDFIFCTEVMEHVVDWNMAFNNFSNLLAPGGRLFITCPHFYQLHEEPYDFWRATPYALSHFGHKFGLKILHQVNAGDGWDVLGTFITSCYALPASRSISDRILSKIINLLKQWLFNLLKSRKIQHSVHLQGSIYISNIIVFVKT